MNISKLQNYSLLILLVLTAFSLPGCDEQEPTELPNILWLTSEDNSPLLGCYGDRFADTPNLDRLASQGFLYTHAYANAPVCAPARNTIITGIYACSGGNQHMRSTYSKSQKVKTYPEFLREAGYYCTNNSKTDYNTASINPRQIWDECSKTAHYKNRPPGKPFFAVFNTTISHESSIHDSISDEKLRHSPDEVTLPPYHPSTPAMKHDWAQYYDKVEDMDTQIGKWLKELEEEGLAENTIVFYYGDHGGVIARSKRFVYETGTRVPFIVRIPEKYKYLFPSDKLGDKVDRLVSFVDLAPTLLSIAGIPIPEYMQGNAFLGKQKTSDPEYAFMFRGRMDEKYDMCRAVRGHKFRYIRNYMPYRNYGQHLDYLWRAPSVRSWEQAFNNGECNETQSIFWQAKPVEELYDTENDPWEINNLSDNPEYKNILVKMRQKGMEWSGKIKDAGFIPEADLKDRTEEMPIYDYMRSGEIDLERVINAADIAISGNSENLETLKTFLKDDESAVRYWGAAGMLILGQKAAPAKADLQSALNDKSANVVTVAAETLYNLGEKEAALKALTAVLKNPNEFARCHALNAIDCMDESSPFIIGEVVNMTKASANINRGSYDLRAARWLFQKWELIPEDYGLSFDW